MSATRLRIGLAAACIAALSSCGGDTPTGQTPVTPAAPAAPVTPTTASLFIDSIVPRVYVGRTGQLAFEVRDKNGAAVTGRTITWSSSASAVVTVSASGLLTGVSVGTSTITGSVDGVSASRVVSVLALPSALIAVVPEVAALARGVDLPLTAAVTDVDGKLVTGHAVTFTSSDNAIATVSATGVVHPLANGSVNVVAMVDGQQQATTHLTVYNPTTVNGVVATSDGGAIPALNFTAQFNSGAALPQTFTTTIDRTTGAFALVVPAFTTAGPGMEFYVDVPAGAPRLYHPSWLKLNPGFVPNGSRILLIPHKVTPDSGTSG